MLACRATLSPGRHSLRDAEQRGDRHDPLWGARLRRDDQRRATCLLRHRPPDEGAALGLGAGKRSQFVQDAWPRLVANLKLVPRQASDRGCRRGQLLPTAEPFSTIGRPQRAGQRKVAAVGRFLHGISSAGSAPPRQATHRYAARRDAALVCGSPDKGFADRSDAWWPAPYWDIDTGFASLLVLLTAVDAGLGTCFFGIPVDRIDTFREAFGVPPS